VTGVKRNIRKALLCLGLAALLAAIGAASAPAAPQFEIGLERDAADFPIVNRGDERVDYTVKVTNVASASVEPPQVGTQLTCDGAGPPLGTKEWALETPNSFSFAFRWLRNGEPIGPWVAGAPGTTYTVQAADAGKALQCLVKGTNGSGSGSFLFPSQPVAVVDPQPAVEPPKPDPGKFHRQIRSGIAGPFQPGTETPGEWKAGDELSCTAPPASGWSGATIDEWKLEWVRDGEPAPGAASSPTPTTSRYTLTAEDVSAPAAPAQFQCMATAVNAGGAAVVESLHHATESPAPEFAPGFGDENSPIIPNSEHIPVVEWPGNQTSGPVTLELELPGGEETFAHQFQQLGSGGWSCERLLAAGGEPAKALCTRSDALQPESSYPSLEVIAAIGADAPDIAVAKATVSGGGAPAAASDEDAFAFVENPFGLALFASALYDHEGNEYTQAGGHPFLGTANFVFNKKRRLVPATGGTGAPDDKSTYAPVEHVREGRLDVPRGIVGNALAVPELCPSADLVVTNSCPPGSVVGGVHIVLSEVSLTPPVFAMEPEFGTPAQFAFSEPAGNVFTITTRLRPEDGYAVTFELTPPPVIDLLSADFTFCDFGAIFTGGSGGNFLGCKKPGDAGANPKPLFANPTRCEGPPPRPRNRIDSWENPGNYKEYEFTNAPIVGCEQVDFEPEVEIQPNSNQADSPTGLDLELTMPTDGLENPFGISQANLKLAKIVFPKGMALNATAGQGLGACTPEQVKLKTNDPIECPDSSKVGTIEIETPLIQETLSGNAYIAKQGAVDGAPIGLYLVFDSKKDGITIKMPGKVVPDPVTGQLAATFDESPEAPFSAVRVHFDQGPRSPLLTPAKCGRYTIAAEMVPWTVKDLANPDPSETVTEASTFQVSKGPGGGPCPKGDLEPSLSGGTENPLAGQTSPFTVRLSRPDGSERFRALGLKLPKGLSAYLKGVPYCPDAVLASIPGAEGTGQGEIDNPSCPQASQVGRVSAAAGAGPNPLYVDTARAYLAGPYKGAPLSVAVVAPAVAGPLDLGSVTVRNALYLDPETAEASVVSDPIPTMLHGIFLNIRDIRVAIDRPDFTLNPTGCEEKSLLGTVSGESGQSVQLSDRFQVDGCEALPFKPKLSIRLFGGTKRGGHPSLRGVLTAKPGEANIARAQVTIPRSAFLDQAHIRTICTRVQFAARECPPGAVYGYASAITPLVDYPVQGPVYLRSSDNKLPDLVVALRGPEHQPIEAAVVGRIDSVKGQIRATFEATPDVPLTKFVLTMQGGKKGLLVNSRDICAGTFRATVALEGHNGRTHTARPVMRNGKCGKGRKGRRGSKRR
jgi:hypothetical protein